MTRPRAMTSAQPVEGGYLYGARFYSEREWRARERRREQWRASKRRLNSPEIVDGLILYGDQAYSVAEWEARNRQRSPAQKERRRAYEREYYRRNSERINSYNREWMARYRPRPRLVGSLHSLACTGPTKASGCRCHKIRCYSKPPRPSLRVAE